MEVAAATTIDQYYKPFFPHCVTILSGATNQGKSTLLQSIIKNQHLCFVRPFNRVLVVLCNNKVNSSSYKNLETDSLTVDITFIEEFDTEDISDQDLVIFEDIKTLTSDIIETVNVIAHHSDLASVFVVCQCVFDSKFKILLSIAHQVLIFLNGVQGIQLAQRIRIYYFQNQDLKDHIKAIVSYAEQKRETLLLKLNDIAREDNPYYFAISGFEHFINQKQYQTFIYPQLYTESFYKTMFSNNFVEVSDSNPATYPKGSYLLVPAENVIQKSLNAPTDLPTKENEWHRLNQLVESDLSALKYNRQQTAKEIAKFMLSSKHFTFTNNGRAVMITGQPKTLVSTLDFLNAISRSAGPSENPNPIFVQFTKILLQSHIPQMHLKNKSLITGSKPLSLKPMGFKASKSNIKDPYFQ
jgi:hypothetical protein